MDGMFLLLKGFVSETKNRLYAFAIYYTHINDCLVRIYDKYGIWTETYCKGVQIWNVY